MVDFTSRSIHLMGTTITISILHHRADLLLDEVVHLLFMYEKRFSANDDTSELMQINHHAGQQWVQVHSDLFELIELGKQHSLAQNSHLNISIGPLVQTWRIGIQHPKLRRGNNLAILPIVNQSVVTSGIYERTLEKQGQSYHHILDSKTGYPVETDVASLTIVSDHSVEGEIWTTRLFSENPASILEQVEKEEQIEALGITKDDQLFYTSGLKPELLF